MRNLFRYPGFMSGMKRWIGGALMVMAGTELAMAVATPPKPPNIVWIVGEDMNPG